MGFYQPAQLVIDARNHGVEVRPVDINHSLWDHQLEEQHGKYRALRLGFRLVKGLREDDTNLLIEKRGGGYTCVNALRDAGLPESALEKLADADAFNSIGLDRRQALWEVSTKDKGEALFEGQQSEDAKVEDVLLPLMTSSEHVVEDYATTSLSIKAHPVSFAREKLSSLHVVSAKGLKSAKDGQLVKVAGLVLVRQRPGTAGGVCFITIEDETGFANLVVFKNVFEAHLKTVLHAHLMMAEGKLQVEGEVIHVIVSRCYDISKMLQRLTPASPPRLPALKPEPSEVGGDPDRKRGSGLVSARQEKLFGDARNFK
jgi:error-prone DNA polymerase